MALESYERSSIYLKFCLFVLIIGLIFLNVFIFYFVILIFLTYFGNLSYKVHFVDNQLLATVRLHRFIAVDTCPAYQGPFYILSKCVWEWKHSNSCHSGQRTMTCDSCWNINWFCNIKMWVSDRCGVAGSALGFDFLLI